MRRSATIFDSRAEQRLYQALKTRWSDRGVIYPQLPLAKLIELDEHDARLTRGERNYFYSANVDFTFCRDNRAELSIEFDGIGGGFSRSGTYVPARVTEDPHRELKMGFKLRAAAAAEYPFVVVSYDETEVVAPDTSLTVLDSIIGRFLGHIDFEQRFAAGIREAAHQLERMHPDEAQATVDWIGTNAEFDAAWDNDPLTPLVWQEAGRYRKAYPEGAWEWRSPHDETTDRVGAVVKVKVPGGEVVERAWVRKIGGATGVHAGSIAENLATYTALRRANKLLGVHGAE